MCHWELEQEETNHIQIKGFYQAVMKPCIHTGPLHAQTLFIMATISSILSMWEHAEHGCRMTEHRKAKDEQLNATTR